MIERATKGRACVLKNGNRLEIQIPAKKSWFSIAFLTAWLGGWVMGETFAITQMSNAPFSENAFMLFWLIGWTAGGVLAIIALLRYMGGSEIIKVDSGVLELRKQIFNFKTTKRYNIAEIKNLTINPVTKDNTSGHDDQENNTKNGIIKFEYGMKTIKVGRDLDEAEGRLLIEAFKLNSNFKETNFG